MKQIRGVGNGGAGVQPPNFGVLLTLFKLDRANYAHHVTASTSKFENLTTSLQISHVKSKYLPIWDSAFCQLLKIIKCFY